MTTGAALEVDVLGFLEFLLGHRRRLGVDVLVHCRIADRRRIAGLIVLFDL
jgi:hypothetical protein